MRRSAKHRSREDVSLDLLKQSDSMDPKERTFLDAVEKGDKHTMERCLQAPNPVNVNCTNILGRSAIQIAVDNENVEIVDLLLKQENVRIGDALLYAIREGVYKIVEMLIDHKSMTNHMLAQDWDAGESADYSPDISPIILAAHCNQFEILQLFLSRGAFIEKPHQRSCTCQRCCEAFLHDSLRYSLKRINTYRALASPAWISLTSEDPILTAFKLSWELNRLAEIENEFKETYIELSKECKKYSCDLLNLCRSTHEVVTVLNHSDSKDETDTDEEEGEDGFGKLTFDRLKLALKLKQKEFVALPNCQQLLTSIWYEGLPLWRRSNKFCKCCILALVTLGMPLIATYHLLFPTSKLSKIIRSPFMKFIYHSTSFAMFLLLLILASFRSNEERQVSSIRGPSPSFIEWLIVFWVFGMVWSECKQLWDEGLKAYVWSTWNWLDFIMLELYLTSYSLKAVAFILIQSGKFGPRIIDRKYWSWNDPTLVSEGLFAVANVFSFARIIYLFQTNPYLGPLQISLGCMFVDIAKFLFIFFLVLVSFACGLYQLYWYYEVSSPVTFKTIGSTFATLFWSIFGLSSPRSTEFVDSASNVIFVEYVGTMLFMCYHVMTITVLINMLIAMITKSFQVITDHADVEWKFARSQLWLGYFDEGSTLPPPYNILLSPKSIKKAYWELRELWEGFQKKSQVAPERKESANRQSKHGAKAERLKHYKDVMKRLVCRYIYARKKQMRADGVNEDDLLEIKQDISSLRFELREDRKRDAARVSTKLDSIKKDIIQVFKEGNTS